MGVRAFIRLEGAVAQEMRMWKRWPGWKPVVAIRLKHLAGVIAGLDHFKHVG